MAVVLAAGGFLLYHHLATSLDRTISQGLRARAADISALVQQADTGLRDSQSVQETATALRRCSTYIADLRPDTVSRRALLTPAQLARPTPPLVVGRATRISESVRLLATPVSAQGKRLVVVVGVPLETATTRSRRFGPSCSSGALGPAPRIAHRLPDRSAALRPVEKCGHAPRRLGDLLLRASAVAPSKDEVARLGETLNEMLGRLEKAVGRERSLRRRREPRA